MTGRCPTCGIRLPLSGEPNCDCGAGNAAETPQAPRRAPRTTVRVVVDPPGTAEPQGAPSYFSDEALRKQAALDALGATPSFSMLAGILEPRVRPTTDERCNCCGLDARDSESGEEHHGKRWCFICIGRGHHEDGD